MSRGRRVALSPREVDVLDELLFDGGSNETIASRLYLSEHTVKTHLKNILRKTGCKNRTALVLDVMRGDVVASALSEEELADEGASGPGAAAGPSAPAPRGLAGPDRVPVLLPSGLR